MPRLIAYGWLAGLITTVICVPGQARQPQQAHIVFFQLKERTEEAREKLVAACDQYLSGHRGVVHYSAGIVASDMQREVNVRNFDVSLHIVFANKTAHDRYQTAPRHLQFVKENQSSWESVRVFDSYVIPLRRPRTDRGGERALNPAGGPDRRDRRVALPDPAANFAGMIRGKVVAKRAHDGMLFRVQEVTELWKHCRAKDPQALVGKIVLVHAGKTGGEAATAIERYVAGLEVGSSMTLDVAHQQGEALTIVELTAKQRQQVATD